jgi:hypothetical protein
LTWDGNLLAIGSVLQTGLTADTVIMSVGVTASEAAYFDYVVYNNGSPSARRAGTVIAVWDSTGATCTDFSTPDLNNSTNSLEFNVQNTGSQVNLIAQIVSGTWTVKIGARSF